MDLTVVSSFASNYRTMEFSTIQKGNFITGRFLSGFFRIEDVRTELTVRAGRTHEDRHGRLKRFIERDRGGRRKHQILPNDFLAFAAKIGKLTLVMNSGSRRRISPAVVGMVGNISRPPSESGRRRSNRAAVRILLRSELRV